MFLNSLQKHIRTQGPITIAAFMAEALLHPNHGYYKTAKPIGLSGDFITAPEISQIFGELIGLWMVEMWRISGAPKQFGLVEVGPGRGTLMIDALRAMKVVPKFLDAASVHLVETSPVLRTIQQERLAKYNPTWHESVASLPEIPNFIIANEFFDALPIHQFRFTNAGWREVLVDFVKGNLVLVLSPGPSPYSALISNEVTLNAKVGDITEVCPAAISLFEILASGILKNGGAALIIDYGCEFKKPHATLQAVRDHKAHNILDDPGQLDISAHLDFAALKRALPKGISYWGPIPQGQFLLAMGLETRAFQLAKNASGEQALIISDACKRLVAPSEMGALFKAMAITSEEGMLTSFLPGFN